MQKSLTLANRFLMGFFSILLYLALPVRSADKILDHQVVLDEQGRLQPWTSYDNIIQWSVNYINHCPTRQTKFGQDPWYLVTAKFDEDGAYLSKQNNQGSNVYYAMETAKKYYAYSGDRSLFKAVRLLIDRVLLYCTPEGWSWSRVPVTQDDSPDGEYTDEWGEPDKMCLVAIGCIDFYKFTGEKKYLDAARQIIRTVSQHVTPGDESHSPLPYRVHLQTGRVVDPYDAGLISVVKCFETVLPFCSEQEQQEYRAKSQVVWQWLFKYPMSNYRWSGYYEDVVSNHNNLNQHTPMETARYILQHPEIDGEYQQHIPALCQWVENRFGKTKHYGATSIREQDSCFMEMSSHTARYASVVAMWYGVSGQAKDYEEARAAFALATYSAYNKYSQDLKAMNYVGIGYSDPWFSDSYFDYLTHIFDGLAEIPAMMTHVRDRMLKSSSVVQKIDYRNKQISYRTFEADGFDLFYLTFTPAVYSGNRPLASSAWEFGAYRGAQNILRIHRTGTRQIRIVSAK